MIINAKYKDVKNIVISFLERNNINSVDVNDSLDIIDTIKIGNKLGFDIKKANVFNDDIGLLLVDEREEVIEEFNSNKVIVYKNDLTLNESMIVVARELAKYIINKSNNDTEKIVVEDRYNQDTCNKDIMINMVANTLISPLTYIDSNIMINVDVKDKSHTVIKHSITRREPSAKYKSYIPQESKEYVDRVIKAAEDENAKALKYAHRYIVR